MVGTLIITRSTLQCIVEDDLLLRGYVLAFGVTHRDFIDHEIEIFTTWTCFVNAKKISAT